MINTSAKSGTLSCTWSCMFYELTVRNIDVCANHRARNDFYSVAPTVDRAFENEWLACLVTPFVLKDRDGVGRRIVRISLNCGLDVFWSKYRNKTLGWLPNILSIREPLQCGMPVLTAKTAWCKEFGCGHACLGSNDCIDLELKRYRYFIEMRLFI